MNRIFVFLALFCALTSVWAETAVFDKVLAPRPFQHPRDHGAHFNYPTEWWYFTGHLEDGAANTFGFELTFFRVGISPDPPLAGTFQARSLLVAHYALTDDKNRKFYHTELVERDAFPGIAGFSDKRLHVWVHDWRAEMNDTTISLQASGVETELRLKLQPKKPLVLHGDNGFSQKGAEAGAASYYSSFTRLEGEGTLTVPGFNAKPVRVVGAWMDHEVLSTAVGPQASGWDWYAIQLSSGEELMLYHLKESDGRLSSFSSGSYISRSGTVQHLQEEDFSIEPLAQWTSAQTGITYPSGWQIRVPARDIVLTVQPTVLEQEMITKRSTGMTYWEGRSTVTGTQGTQSLQGNAYVELVGYR